MFPLSTELIAKCKLATVLNEILVLTFRALALRSDEGLTL